MKWETTIVEEVQKKHLFSSPQTKLNGRTNERKAMSERDLRPGDWQDRRDLKLEPEDVERYKIVNIKAF